AARSSPRSRRAPTRERLPSARRAPRRRPGRCRRKRRTKEGRSFRRWRVTDRREPRLRSRSPSPWACRARARTPSVRRRRGAWRGSRRRRAVPSAPDESGRRESLDPPRLDYPAQELACPLFAWLREELFGRPFLEDDAGVEKADLVGHIAGEAHLVRGDD